MSRGARTRLERGLYADRYGLSAVVRVGTLRREKRFPADADRDRIARWRADTTAALLADHQAQTRQRADARSLTRSVAAFLRRRRGRASYRADRSHLKAWIPDLGSKRRHQVTREDVERVIARWREAGVKPRTVRHRCRVLRELYQALDGPTVHHPLIGVVLPSPARVAPIPVAASIIRDVAASLKAGKRHAKGYGDDPIKSRARFLVYATTGQRPSQIGRAQPGDVDLERRVWFVRPAKGGDPIPLPLNDDMAQAWETFIAAAAWGAFDATGLAKVLRRHGWPTGVRPYALRHTFAIDLLLAGADLGDVQGLLGHASITTTREYYAPILLSRLISTVQKRALKLDAATPMVPRTASTPRQKAGQSGTFRHGRRIQKKGASSRKRP